MKERDQKLRERDKKILERSKIKRDQKLRDQKLVVRKYVYVSEDIYTCVIL